MSAEDISRIEAKIDLIFRILMNLEIEGRTPYDFDYLRQFLSEITSLFNIQVEDPQIAVPDAKALKQLQEQLIELEKTLKNGDFLKKDETSLLSRKNTLEETIEKWHLAWQNYHEKSSESKQRAEMKKFVLFQKKVGMRRLFKK